MARRAVSFAQSAALDLEEIRAWYLAQSAPEVGERLVRQVVEQIDRLAEFPEMGRAVPEFGQSPLRELIHPPFRIVYRLDGERVRVVRVWRSERLMTPPSPNP